jgi:hypothetical protein
MIQRKLLYILDIFFLASVFFLASGEVSPVDSSPAINNYNLKEISIRALVGQISEKELRPGLPEVEDAWKGLAGLKRT